MSTLYKESDLVQGGPAGMDSGFLFDFRLKIGRRKSQTSSLRTQNQTIAQKSGLVWLAERGWFLISAPAYAAQGFNPSVGQEHPLHVYAAKGFIVLNTSFPWPTDEAARLGASFMSELYSAELGFPHLTMLMESTVRALNAVAARGFIDMQRVGIGGVSHGTFVPLYLLQKHDLITAISIAGPGWGPHEYYLNTRNGRKATAALIGKVGYQEWPMKPVGPGAEYWSQFDIADHVEDIEAPILMNTTAAETFGMLRFIRHLEDSAKPYDAYVFPNDTHIKWQPAHLEAIQNRNLDWFRFWLQDYEDPDPTKMAQYARWRELRDLQCRNIRAVRDFCSPQKDGQGASGLAIDGRDDSLRAH